MEYIFRLIIEIDHLLPQSKGVQTDQEEKACIEVMNVFGGAASGGVMDEGPRGPRGFRGKDSSMNDVCIWLPQTFINNLQVNDEEGSFFIKNPEKDLIRKEQVITDWVSRS